MYSEKLKKLGLTNVTEDSIIGYYYYSYFRSAYTTAQYLKSINSIGPTYWIRKSRYIIGEEGLTAELSKIGIEVVVDLNPDIIVKQVVCGLDW